MSYEPERARTRAELSGGTLEGERRDGIRVFKGIPFAEPPVEALRFAAPRPPRPWAGVRDASRFALPALQPPPASDPPLPGSGAVAEIGSEDCLYLDVYAPDSPGPHPVMVWIHGGGAIVGSTSECDGTKLAQLGVVAVPIAYRLGALGLLYLPGVFDEHADCNFALLDQIAALQWVAEHIAAFGGDPARVTIAGASNGARSVGNLLAAPAARGLFQQAVSMSGTGVGQLVAKPDEARRLTDAVLAGLRLDLPTASRLREIDAAEVLAAQTRVLSSWPALVAFQVVVGGCAMLERPIDAIAAGAAGKVPLIVGTTHDEYEWFRMAQAGEARSMLVDDAQFEQAIAACRQLLPPTWSEEEVRSHAITCADWRMPAIRLAQASVGAGAQTWMYRLDWRLAPRGVGVGAPHGLDASLMSPRDPDYERVIVPAARRDVKDLEDVIEAMREAIARFVATGDPGPQWPAYDLAARSTFLFDDTCGVAQDPERDLRLLWQDVI